MPHRSNLMTIEQFYQRYGDSPKPPKSVAIAEIAGKDSIAAVIRIFEKEPFEKLYGVALYHRGMHGNLDEPLEHFETLMTILKTAKPEIESEFIYLDIADLFETTLLKTMAIIQKYFWQYSPCPPCHLLFHMIRVPIAKTLGVSQMISGERVSHSGRVKLNQLEEILDLFHEILEKQGISLLQPLKKVKEDKTIQNLLGERWESAEPLNCCFSGSYYEENGVIPFNKNKIVQSLEVFYAPLFTRILDFIESTRKEPDAEKIMQMIIGILSGFTLNV